MCPGPRHLSSLKPAANEVLFAKPCAGTKKPEEAGRHHKLMAECTRNPGPSDGVKSKEPVSKTVPFQKVVVLLVEVTDSG